MRRMTDKRLTPFEFAARAEFAAVSEATPNVRQFRGVAYGGGLITDHPYLGPLVIDIASSQFAAPAPALYDHDQPIGVIDSVDLANQISIAGKLFSAANVKAKEVVEMADAGMPWQMSVGVRPGKIEEFGRGEKVTVNGQNFTGPLTVFRNNRIRETSFTALGAATDTNAQIFSIGGKSPATIPGDTEMDQAEHDRIVAELNTKLAAATDKATAAEASAAELSAKFNALADSNKAKEKAERETAVKALFKTIALEYKDDVAKPYLEMSADAFAAVSAQMTKRPHLDATLTGEQTTEGGAAVDVNDHLELGTKAREYMAEMKAKGVEVPADKAVAHVKKLFAAKA